VTAACTAYVANADKCTACDNTKFLNSGAGTCTGTRTKSINTKCTDAG